MTSEWHPQKCPTHLNYHLTCAEYEQLVRHADGQCHLCGNPPRHATNWLYIDHDHQLGQRAVRGRLCAGCNTKVGKFETGSRALDPAMDDYLARPFYLVLGIDVFSCPAECRRRHHKIWNAA